jgi:hypothetical protein
MSLKIPDRSKDGLARLIAFDDATIEKFAAALEAQPPKLGIGCLAAQVGRSVGLSESETEPLIRILFSLYSVRHEEGLSVDEMVDEVREALAKAGDDRLKLSDEAWRSFALRIRRLLSLDRSFGVMVKALDIQFDYPRHFHGARILTDARPVFSEEVTEEPTSFIVTHVLKLTIHEDGAEKDWFVAMSSDDLENLRKTIDRAIVKERSLSSVLRKSSARVLEWED